MRRNRQSVGKEQIKKRWVSRRQFLAGAGAALTLPPLVSLMPEATARAATGKKVRAVLYVGYCGIDMQHLVPANPTVPTQAAPDILHKPLTSFGGAISRVIDADFAPVLPKMNLIHGLSLCGGRYQGHNATVLAGTHSQGREPTFGRSIDVVMEKSSGVYAPGDVVAVKALRTSDGLGSTTMSFECSGGVRTQPSFTFGDQNIFNQLFAGLKPADAEPEANPFPDQMIVDRVLDDLHALENNRRLSSADSRILEQYISGVQEVQGKIRANQLGLGPKCEVPSIAFQANTSGNSWQFPWNTQWGVKDAGALYDNIMDMIQLAFVCDLTRVVLISNTHWSNQPISSSSDGGIHHDCASSELAADRQKWGLKKMLRLAKALDQTSDPFGDGTLLDNSSMLWTNELGAWTTAHSTLAMPAVTFGGGGGYFRTGNYVDYRQGPLASSTKKELGRPYKQLLQSIMLSMGVPKSEYMNYGDGKGFGEFVQGIDQFGYVVGDAFAPYAGTHNDALPFLSIG
ncbi:MAG: DUF1552 domain-containing protein [Polyangiales bacterium]